MKRRYWFICIEMKSQTAEGKRNMGFVSDDDNPLNNNTIANEALKTMPKFERKHLVVTNLFEFKNEQDYIDFWKTVE